MAERMRQIDYAKRHGLSKQRVHQLKADGRVVIDADGLVDVEASDRNLATMIDQRRANFARQIELAGRAAPPGPWFGAEVLSAAGEKQEVPAGAEQGQNQVERPANTVDHGQTQVERPSNTLEQGPNQAERSPSARESNPATDYWTHKALREASEAAMSELKLQERLGNLIELAEVRRAVRELVSRAANKLQQLPAQLAPVVAAMQDPQQIEVLLTERVQKVLDEFADELDQLASTATADRTEPAQ